MLIFVTSLMSQDLLRHSDRKQLLKLLTKQSMDHMSSVHVDHMTYSVSRVDVSQRDKLGAIGMAKAQQEMKVNS